jgi:hypothetical protein
MPTIVIQPDETLGKDSAVWEDQPTKTSGSENALRFGNIYYGNSYDERFALLQFDLSSIPENAVISQAQFTVYKNALTSGGAFYEIDYEVFKVTSGWDEAAVNWNTKPSMVGTGVTTKIAPYPSTGGIGYHSWDVKNLILGWHDGTIPNFGLALGEVQGLKNYRDDSSVIHVSSSSDTTESLRPKLEITYNVPPTKPVVTAPNGGETWNESHTIQWNAATDAEGSPLKYQIQVSTDNGSSWSNIVSLTSLGVTSYAYNFKDVPSTSLAKIRIRAYDGALYGDWDESDGVFTIQHNVAPLTPSNLYPNGGIIDRTIVQRLSWKHNDDNAQGKAVIEWKLQNGVSWNTVEVNSSNQYNDFAPGFFLAGTIVWRVKTYDQYNLESPYSDIVAFESAAPTNAPAVSPISTAVSRPTVQWSSLGQIAYQIIVTDSNNNTIWDTGEVTSTNKARTVGVSFENGGTYTVKVRVKDATNLWSDYASQTITVSYTPPANPIIGVNKADGHLVIDIHNPVPTGTQPSVIGNDVFKKIDGNWVMIAENIFYQYRDYEVGSGKVYEYMVTAHGDNETSTSSTSASGSVKLHGVWLHQITDPEASVYHFKYDGGGRASQWEVESSRMMFKGRKYPVIETGEMHNDLVSFSLTLTSEDERIALEKLVYSHSMLCYRDGRGRLVVGMITRLPLEDEIWGGQTTSLEIIRVDYKEGV